MRDTLEGKKCNTSTECRDLSLSCDTPTKTCKRGYFASCLVDSDCLVTEKCINQLCGCVRDLKLKIFY